MNDVLSKIDTRLSLEELGEITRAALSTIYSKLIVEEGLSADMHCYVTDIGPDEYDVTMAFVDGGSHDSGIDWPKTFYI